MRDAAKLYGVEALITDDYLEVEARVAELQPELVLGTQMERHIAKRLGIPCAVISAPMHVQDFPARYSPQMGFEGANVLFDTWVHPLMMGLEEHLLTMFRDDFEFHDGAAASHLGRSGGPDAARSVALADDTAAEPAGADSAAAGLAATAIAAASSSSAIAVADWAPEAEKELQKIPFFVRGKARRNTERFAAERGVAADHRRDPVRCQSALQPLRPAQRPLRVVLVTMDSHLASAAERANRAAGARAAGPDADGACRRRMGRATTRRCSAAMPTSPRGDIVIVTMLFMEDHFLPVLPALKARREHCDAMVCAMSAGEVMKLTRMGKFNMDKPASGALALLKRLRGKGSTPGQQDRQHRRRAADEDAAPAAEDPALHPRHGAGRARLFPDAAVLAGRLAGEHRQPGAHAGATAMPPARARACAALAKPQPPVEYPEVGVYHPRMAGRACTTACRTTSPSCRAWPPAASAARSACW